MVNRTIDLPSKRAKIVMDIERPLRRKFRTRKSYFWVYFFIVVIILAAVVEFLVWKPVFTTRAEAHVPDDNGYFCSQLLQGNYVADVKTFKYCEGLKNFMKKYPDNDLEGPVEVIETRD